MNRLGELGEIGNHICRQHTDVTGTLHVFTRATRLPHNDHEVEAVCVHASAAVFDNRKQSTNMLTEAHVFQAKVLMAYH